MTGHVLILADHADADLTRRLVLIVEFAGLTPDVLSLRTPLYSPEAADKLTACSCVLVSADALLAFPECDVMSIARPVLVYGFRPCAAHVTVSSTLSGGGVRDVNPVNNNAEYSVPEAGRAVTGYFAGMQFGPAQPASDSTFNLDSRKSPDVLIGIGGDGLLLRCRRPDGDVYLLGVDSVADLGHETDRLPPVATLFSTLVAFIMFLRHTCSEPYQSFLPPHACVVLDDPLLRPHYGFVHYEQLLQDMEKHNYTVCVSHIPHNSYLTSKQTAVLFNTHRDCLSICVHGCDHAPAEFATEDEDLLHGMLSKSRKLMNTHQRRTWVPWDRVMVFSHGRFSVAATQAMLDSDICAAVVSDVALNSDQNPTGSRDRTHHPLAAFLAPAVTAYGGVPILLRRYPKQIEAFAFDLFMGRPVLISTHHRDFRDHARALHAFIDRLNALEPNLVWGRLQDVVNRYAPEADTLEQQRYKPVRRRRQRPWLWQLCHLGRRHLVVLRDNGMQALERMRGGARHHRGW